MVRGKFKLHAITSNCWNPNSKMLRFMTEYDPTVPEDVAFCKATPSGTFEMQVDNPAALAQFELGKCYYLDMSPVPVEVPGAAAAA